MSLHSQWNISVLVLQLTILVKLTISSCPKYVSSWHKCLGHMIVIKLLVVAKLFNIPLDPKVKSNKCELCV